MPSAADTLLFSPSCRVTLTALKWSGAAVRFGSFVAATTVRVIADWAGVVCATQGAGSTIAPSNIIPIVLNCMPASQFKGSPDYHTLSERLLEWPAALAAIGWLQCAGWGGTKGGHSGPRPKTPPGGEPVVARITPASAAR